MLLTFLSFLGFSLFPWMAHWESTLEMFIE